MTLSIDSSERRRVQTESKRSVEVSIIILNWNKTELTLSCVENVRSHTQGVECEIIVLDNGSDPDAAKRLQMQLGENIRLISLKHNVFFGEGNNIAAEAARGQFLLLINNDVTFTSNCVSELLVRFKSCWLPAAVGPRFLYPDGALQEAGAFIRPDGWSIQQGKGNAVLDPHFEKGCHIVDYCSAACLLIERCTFLLVGGFDPLFDPAYFEDCDLCLRLRSIGLYTYFASEVSVYHQENTTSIELWGELKLNAIAVGNRQKFVRRWGDYLKKRINEKVPFPETVSSIAVRQLISEPTDLPSIILVSSSIIQMSDDCFAMIRCAALLEDMNKIVFAAPEICSRLRIRSICRHLGIQLSNFDIVEMSDEVLQLHDRVLFFPSASAYHSNMELLKSIYHSSTARAGRH